MEDRTNGLHHLALSVICVLTMLAVIHMCGLLSPRLVHGFDILWTPVQILRVTTAATAHTAASPAPLELLTKFVGLSSRQCVSFGGCDYDAGGPKQGWRDYF